MLVQLKPNLSVAKSVQLFKGGSSKKIREEFPELEEFLWGDSFWADGYFAETVGQITESRLKQYSRLLIITASFIISIIPKKISLGVLILAPFWGFGN